MPKKWALINLAWVFLILSACGWQLRDNALLELNLGTVYVSYPESQNSIGIKLKRELKANNILLVGATENANYQIKIIDATQSRRISALNANVRAAQYQLYQAVDYIVLDEMGTQLIPITTAAAESTFNFNEQDVLASHNEEVILQNNLRAKIVRQIIHRLGEVSDSSVGQ
ncbi:MAG: LPS assembly lipoprotein LptE [Porticoccaceae bacterium]